MRNKGEDRRAIAIAVLWFPAVVAAQYVDEDAELLIGAAALLLLCLAAAAWLIAEVVNQSRGS